MQQIFRGLRAPPSDTPKIAMPGFRVQPEKVMKNLPVRTGGLAFRVAKCGKALIFLGFGSNGPSGKSVAKGSKKILTPEYLLTRPCPRAAYHP
jgi:hypothetical protein